MRLVLVHGRGQEGKSSESLTTIWRAALDVGLENARLESISNHEIILPYYGDALAENVRRLRSADADAGGMTAKGPKPAPSRIEVLQANMLQEYLPSDATPSPTPAVIQKGPQNTAVALALARLADSSPWGADLLSMVTEDVAVYLDSTVAAREINAIVKEAIPTHEPCVVIGHSLGSVVAYRVLRELGKTVDVVQFVTIGSPLGLVTIRDALRPLSVPPGVRSWLNVYDPRDIVALRALDQSTWPVTPAITNISLEQNHMSNRHGISGYLDWVEVASAVFNSLNGLSEHFMS